MLIRFFYRRLDCSWLYTADRGIGRQRGWWDYIQGRASSSSGARCCANIRNKCWYCQAWKSVSQPSAAAVGCFDHRRAAAVVTLTILRHQRTIRIQSIDCTYSLLYCMYIQYIPIRHPHSNIDLLGWPFSCLLRTPSPPTFLRFLFIILIIIIYSTVAWKLSLLW